MLAGVRDRRAQVRQIFAEMTSVSADNRRDTPGAAKLIGMYWMMTNQPLPEKATK